MLCLAAGALVTTLAVDAFTLAWTHSIEKIRWEEDWRLAGGRLELVEARIRGSGAGMEPPAGAVLRQGWYEYVPHAQPRGALRLSRAPYVADYEWCDSGDCRPLGDWLASDGGVTLLWACQGRAGT